MNARVSAALGLGSRARAVRSLAKPFREPTYALFFVECVCESFTSELNHAHTSLGSEAEAKSFQSVDDRSNRRQETT